MFEPITTPFRAVMLFNVVKNTYGDDAGGFIGGQVYEYTGFVSEQGSFGSSK